MQRIIVVYNPRSSRYLLVRREVLDRVGNLRGYIIGKYEVKPTDVDQNAADLAKLIRDEDIVIAVGGDGTATIALNGVLLSKKDAKLGVLGYGNFNDLARTLGTKRIEEILDGRVEELWPLEALIDGKHWRYAACYITLGMFAESTAVFDEQKTRKKLKSGGRGRMIYSLWQLIKWYFKNCSREFLPQFKLNGRIVSAKTTDYLAVNGKSMAKMMRGGEWFLNKSKFRKNTTCFGNVIKLCWFMMRSIVHQVPGMGTTGDVLEFVDSAKIEIQAEGEYQKLEDVKKVEIRKATRPVRVILKA